jgi:hypothetical protein
MRPTLTRIVTCAVFAAFSFSACLFPNKDKNEVEDESEVNEISQSANPSQRYVDSLLGIPAFAEKMKDIADAYEPFTIVREGGKFYMMKLDEIEESLKKIPMDSLLAFGDNIYMFDDYDKFNVPGALLLENCYFDRDARKVDLRHIDINPDVKDSRCTAYFRNSTEEHHLKHAVVRISIIVEKDTVVTEKVEIDMDVPPRSVKEVQFTMATMNEKKLGGNMFFNYVFELEDYKLE